MILGIDTFEDLAEEIITTLQNSLCCIKNIAMHYSIKYVSVMVKLVE